MKARVLAARAHASGRPGLALSPDGIRGLLPNAAAGDNSALAPLQPRRKVPMRPLDGPRQVPPKALELACDGMETKL